MTDEFIRRGLTTSVAQICSNIGWHSMANSTLQMMTDILYEYFKDLAQSVKKFSEISDTIEPDIDDVKMAFRDKDVAIPDLIRYLKQVGSVEFPHKVPKFPIPTKSNLNIMKPGSREIVTRPVYVHEHLPTMYPEQSDEKTTQNDRNQTSHSSSSLGIFNDPISIQESQASINDKPTHGNNVMHRRLREISSVVMTTSGFLSPSREGKLPESRLMPFPNFKTNSSQPSTSYSTVPPEVKGEQHQQQRMKQQNRKQSQKILNSFKEKGKNAIESNNNNNKNEGVKVKKLTSMKETSKLKALKTGAIRESNQGPRLKKTQKIKDKSKLNLLNTIFDKPVQASSSHLKYSKNSEGDNEKLTTEPDKQKLNIFKKISKVKEDKNNESSGHQSSKSNMPITSKANSTIVSSDILIKPELKPEVIEEKPLKPIFTKPPIEKKNDSVQKTPVKNTKQELNTNTPKKRKKKPKILNDDYDPPTIDPISSNTGTKKSKNKHDSNLFSSPLKFSFFGHLPTGPGLLPTGPSILPPSLASNPLVPKYTPPNNVIPMLEKPSSTTSMIYLPLPGEDHFEKPELDELSSEKEKVQTEKIKPKKEHKKIKKEKIKSKKKKDKKNKTKQKERSERKKEKLLKKLKNKVKVDTEESKQESTIVKENSPEPVVKEDDHLVPKIKLKLPGSNGSNSSPSIQRKIVIKPIVKNKSPPECAEETHSFSKEKSPVERVKSSIAKSKTHSKDKSSISTLPSVSITPIKEEETEIISEPKPSKLKKSSVISSNTVVDIDIPSASAGNVSSPTGSNPNNSAISGNKQKIKTSKKPKKTATRPFPFFYFDEGGNEVWICPTCGKQDDGSPMIGCDGCDGWYHWVCVGIQCPPDCAVWFCPTCLLKRAERGVSGAPTEKAKRGRPLKKKSIS